MGTLTRRELLLSIPFLAVARRLLAQPALAPIAVRGLHQFTLAVSDVQRSLEFYQGLFGMPVQARQGGTVVLGVGEGPGYLALAEAGSGPPRIDHWGLAVEDFDAERVVEELAAHGVRRVAEGESVSGRPMSVALSVRDGTPRLLLSDPNGLVVQLQHASDCGGRGPLGSVCSAPERSPRPGDLALRDLSHVTTSVPDPAAARAFYQGAFGMDIQAYQATAPLFGAGPGSAFLMFNPTDGGARIGHVCFTVQGFDVERIQRTLEGHGITPRGPAGGETGPLRHWVSMRMPNRGGAPEGTPELYFTDPDGLSVQLQDVTYCGGTGVLGGIC